MKDLLDLDTKEKMVEHFKELESEMIKKFFEMEAFEYFPKARYNFIMKVAYPAVLEAIEKFADDHVTFTSLTNMGQITRTLTIDRFSSEPKETDERGEISVIFCSCGSHVTMTKETSKLIFYEDEDGNRKAKTEKNIKVILGGKCYNNELWKKFKAGVENESFC